MADKKNMACNKVRPSYKRGKKKMVKACEGGKEKLSSKTQVRNSKIKTNSSILGV